MNSDSFNQTELTFLDSKSSVLSKSNKIKFLWELPFNVRRELTDLLDADKTWRELGGKYIGLNETELELISYAILRKESPTNTMFIKWEQTNVTITYLYKCLAKMRHFRAMSFIKEFVDSNLHFMCEELCNEDFFTKKNENNSSKLKSDFLVFNSHKKYATEIEKNKRINNQFIVENNNFNKKDLKNNLKEINDIRIKDKIVLNEANRGKQYQTSDIQSHLKGGFSAVASTINAYDDDLPYEELLIATDNFHVSNVIGSGGFGVVYKGRWKGTKVAIKRLKAGGNLSQAITELKVLSQYRIDNIVPMYGISLDGPVPCLIYQFMVNGSLDDRLQCKKNSLPLTWLQRINIGFGIAKALNYLHTRKGRPLIHGDVKSANILLDAQMQSKLGDFGLAKYLQDEHSINSVSNENCLASKKNFTHVTVTSVHGTVAYLPPEYLRSKILSPAVDVYSYGIVHLEILTGLRAFDGKSLLLDIVLDELDECLKKSSKNCSLLGEFSNPISKNQINEPKMSLLNVQNAYKNKLSCNCLSCEMYKLQDIKLPHTLDNLFWFHCALKLALDCSNKFKKKRPDFATILKNYEIFIDQYKQFNACNQILNLTGMNTNRNSVVSKVTNIDDDDAIKTPLELKLWNELLKKNAVVSAPPLSENKTNEDSFEKPSIKINSNQDLVESLIKLDIDIEKQKKIETNSEKTQVCVNEFIENCEIPLLTELGISQNENKE